jgi:hypothetical protein
MMIIRKSNNFFLQSKQKGGVEIRCISYNHQIKTIRIAAIFDALKPLNIIHRLEAPTLLNRCLPIFFLSCRFCSQLQQQPQLCSPYFLYDTWGLFVSGYTFIYFLFLFCTPYPLVALLCGPVFPPRPFASSSCTASSLRSRRLHVVGERELGPARWRQRGGARAGAGRRRQRGGARARAGAAATARLQLDAPAPGAGAAAIARQWRSYKVFTVAPPL